MSGRQGEGGQKTGRGQQQNYQARGGSNLGPGRVNGGRSAFQPASGRGIAPQFGPPQGSPGYHGVAGPPELSGSNYNPQGESKPQRAHSAQMQTRGVTLPQGMNTFPQAGGIMFGTIVSEDGSLNTMPSPQQPPPQQQDRQSARSPPENSRGGGRGAGRGGRAAGVRSFNKAAGGRGQPGQGQQALTNSPVAFGSGIPPNLAYVPYSSMPGYPPYASYGMGAQVGQPPYPGFQAMYQLPGGYPGQGYHQQQPHHFQQPQPQFPRPHQQQSFQGQQSQPPRTQQTGFPENSKAPASTNSEPRRSKALTITNPTTKQPVVLERPITAPANGTAGPRKQPSQGSPTPRPGPTTSRTLNVTPPASGRPSKAIELKAPPSSSAGENGPVSETAKATATASTEEKEYDLRHRFMQAGTDLADEQKRAPAAATAQPEAEPSSDQSQAADEEAAAQRRAADAAAARKAADEGAAKKAAEDAATAAQQKADDLAAAARRKAEEEAADAAARLRADEEAAAKLKAAEDAAAAKREEEAAAKRKADEEAAARRKADEDAAAKRKSDEEAAAASKRAEAEAAAAKQKADDAEAAARKRAEEEETAATRKADEETATRKAEEETATRKAEEETAAVAAKKSESEAPEADPATQKAPEQEAGLSRSSSAEGLSHTPSTATAQPPKRKGKKALAAAIAARREAETGQYDGREVDMSAFKPRSETSAQAPAESEAAPSEAIDAPPQPPQSGKGAPSPSPADDDVDWEEKKIDTPRATTQAAKEGPQKKQYSRDFLMKINKALLDSQAVEAWEGLDHFDNASGKLLRAAGPDMHPLRGSMRAPPPHIGGLKGDDRWSRGKPVPGGPAPNFQPPGMGGPPPPPGRTGGRAPGRAGVEADRWSRGTPLPAFPAMPRAPPLHKASNRYELGRLISSDPEEEARQREFKSLLNKLTPEKYNVIFQKFIEVGTKGPLTLYGLIDQVFDKALLEPVFCELYATLCHDLSQALPEFEPEPGQNESKKVNFRRSLLNKCQSEFEQGTAAIQAVEAREQADAQSGAKDKEPGEILGEDALAERRRELQEAEMEQKARRRALGNIQFIGHLYKHRMLTEKIMHSCIQTLLQDVEKPRHEDIECLCKLMATIGGQLEASIKSAGYVDQYCGRMAAIQNLEHLEVRFKFMIQDILDMRANRWQTRRKVEGPKAIEEIHREAEREQQAQAAAARAPLDRYGSRNRGLGGGFRDREPPPSMRPTRSRHEDRLDEKPRPMQRTPSQDGMFAPGGRGSGGFRPGGSLGVRAPPTRDAAHSRDAPPAAGGPAMRQHEAAPMPQQRAEGNAPPPPPPPAPAASAGPSVPDETVRTKAKGLLVEFAQLRNPAEVRSILEQELPPSRARLSTAVQSWFETAFETKGLDQAAVKELFVMVATDNLVPKPAILEGIAAALEELHDTAVDVPFAPKLLGDVTGALLGLSAVALPAFAEAVLKAGSTSEDFEEGGDAPLVDSGHAGTVIAAAMEAFAAASGQDKAHAAWSAASLKLPDFLPSFERDDAAVVERLVAKHQLAGVV